MPETEPLSPEKSLHPTVLAVIPARYASSRFPGKPLAEIQGKPMIQHVWERVSQVAEIQQVVIATDDERIRTVAENFGAAVRMTSPDHESGTDRVWEVAADWPYYDWILNVQGDEPFVNPAHLQAVIEATADYQTADIITLVTPLEAWETFQDPNVVKAILSSENQALYFSRAPIPFKRDSGQDKPLAVAHGFRHIGIYLYRRTALEHFIQLRPSTLELIEKLEQLRALEANLSIYAIVVSEAPVGVDTPADLVRVQDFSH